MTLLRVLAIALAALLVAIATPAAIATVIRGSL